MFVFFVYIYIYIFRSGGGIGCDNETSVAVPSWMFAEAPARVALARMTADAPAAHGPVLARGAA